MTMTQQGPSPGSSFDIPGVPNQTQWFDQYEDTQSLAFTPSATTQQPINSIADFRRTDIVLNWRHRFAITAASFTAGTGQTLTTSAYAPYNLLGAVVLQIQNQYQSINVENGIDWFIFNLIRPFWRGQTAGHNNYGNPAGDPLGNQGVGYLNASTPQAPLIPPTGAQWTRSTTAYDLILDVPGGVWLDEYYMLSVDGQYQGALPDCFVSPQYMAGTQRLIKTALQTNPLVATTTDNGPVASTALTPTTDTASTGAATGSLFIRRQGVYGNNDPANLPPPQPWQYRWKTTRFSLTGLTTKFIQIPDDSGQVLSCYLRMFDPSAASGIGGPIQLSTLTNVQFLYGAGLAWFYGTAEECQALWLDQHDYLLPQGVLAMDFALDELNVYSNKRAMNTLTTAGIEWNLTFSASTSTTAYVVLGVESLVYVV